MERHQCKWSHGYATDAEIAAIKPPPPRQGFGKGQVRPKAQASPNAGGKGNQQPARPRQPWQICNSFAANGECDKKLKGLPCTFAHISPKLIENMEAEQAAYNAKYPDAKAPAAAADGAAAKPIGAA